MSSNLKVNTILPSTGTTIGIGTVGGLINVVGNIDVNSTSGISTFNGLEISGIVTAKAGAAVTYYGDGSNLTGISAGAGGDTGLDLNDNVKARFGTGNDLSLFHDSNRSAINNSTGELRILSGSDVTIGKRSGDDSSYSEQLATFKVDGAVELYNDNSKKFETTSYGALVTGTISAGSGNFDVTDNGKFKAGNSSDLEIYHNGSHSFIDQTGTGHLVINSSATNNVDIMKAGHSEYMARFKPDNAVELYFDNTKVLETTNTGVQISHTGDAQLQLLADTDNNGGNNWPHIDFRVDNTSGQAEARIAYRQDNSVLKFDVGGSEKVGVNANGLVFNADTAAANALNDYEEGSFSPIIRTIGSSTGQKTGTGRYTKIGNKVTIQVQFDDKNCSAIQSNNNIQIANIPYTANSYPCTSTVPFAYNVDWNGDRVQSFVTANNTTTLTGFESRSGGSWQYWASNNFRKSQIYLRFNLTYFTNS
jgi:hypothetical protein